MTTKPRALRLDFACPCTATRFSAERGPLFRFYCHCSLCRRFNQAAFADVCVFRAADIQQPRAEQLSFERLRPPPNVARGRCVSCAAPAIELFEAPLLPHLVMVPAGSCQDRQQLPDAAMHCFYESRTQDIDDGLPKKQGYWPSQSAFAALLMRSLWARYRSSH